MYLISFHFIIKKDGFVEEIMSGNGEDKVIGVTHINEQTYKFKLGGPILSHHNQEVFGRFYHGVRMRSDGTYETSNFGCAKCNQDSNYNNIRFPFIISNQFRADDITIFAKLV